jgi:hypothetical protein
MKPTRRFEKKTYNRALNAPKTATRKLQGFADLARKNGWNARVIQNANSSSLFVRRRYNRPIPETDPMRTEVFPVALGAILNSNKELTKAFPQEFVRMTKKRVVELAPNLNENQKAIAREQIKEIKEFTDQIDLHSQELAELGKQSMQNMNMQGFELGKSNLTEEQWAEIYSYQYQDGVTVISRLQGQVRNKAFQSTKSFIQSSDNPLLLEYRSMTDEELIAEINKPQSIISQAYSTWLDSIDQAVQESLVLYLRSNGMSEHSLLASIKYPLMSESPLIYTEWESYIDPSSVTEEPKIRVEPLDKVDQVMITFPGIGGATVEAKIDRKITDSWLNAMRDGSMDVISLESIKKAYERRRYNKRVRVHGESVEVPNLDGIIMDSSGKPGDFYMKRIGPNAGKVYREREGPSDMSITIDQEKSGLMPDFAFYQFQAMEQLLNARKRGTAQQSIRQSDVHEVYANRFIPKEDIEKMKMRVTMLERAEQMSLNDAMNFMQNIANENVMYNEETQEVTLPFEMQVKLQEANRILTEEAAKQGMTINQFLNRGTGPRPGRTYMSEVRR